MNIKEAVSTIEEQINPSRAALIVIDPQKDFCASDGAMSVVLGTDMSRIQEAVPRLNSLIKRARQAEVLIIWTRVILSDDRILPGNRPYFGEGDSKWIVKPDTSGIQWYSKVEKPLPNEPIVTKRNYDAFENTDLELLLRSYGIETLLMTGFTTNVCVETTARHAYVKGYYVVVVSDCTDAATREEYDASILNLGTYFGKAISSDEVVNIWGGYE